MAEIKQVFSILSKPGIQRDGTELDRDFYTDGQWVRFQRGRAKKMGGCQMITDQLSGPIRNMRVWSREDLNAVYSFSPYGVEQLLIDNNGLGSSVTDLSPPGWVVNQNVVWSVDTQYDDAVSSLGTVVLAHASSSAVNIDDTTASKPYLALAGSTTQFTQIADAPAISGGIFSVAPYTFVHGSDGFFAWSDVNLPQTWYTSAAPIGDAGADRITGAKIVKGLPLRSGSGPAAVLWSLDSVLRMDYTGGQSIFRFTHLSTQSSVLAQNSIVDYDGAYFWMGVDRFMASDGSQVRELPNQMNINWVYDNLNYAARQKVFAVKVPRFGEIWWLFPYGDSQECNRAVIYNVREQTWYDNSINRGSGFYSQVFNFPVMGASTPRQDSRLLNLAAVVGTFSVGDKVYDSDTGAVGTIIISGTNFIRVSKVDGPDFITGGIVNQTSGGTAVIVEVRPLYGAYVHEKGNDLVEGDLVTPIESYFITSDFGYPTGGPQPNQVEGLNRWARLIRVEPDFIQQGEMTLFVRGKEFANSPDKESIGYNFTSETERIDMREQRREITLKFVSNTVGGHYEIGRTILHMEPGDVRN